jgi:hypothetical protein
MHEQWTQQWRILVGRDWQKGRDKASSQPNAARLTTEELEACRLVQGVAGLVEENRSEVGGLELALEGASVAAAAAQEGADGILQATTFRLPPSPPPPPNLFLLSGPYARAPSLPFPT